MEDTDGVPEEGTMAAIAEAEWEDNDQKEKEEEGDEEEVEEGDEEDEHRTVEVGGRDEVDFSIRKFGKKLLKMPSKIIKRRKKR